MSRARELAALENSPARRARDESALRHVLTSLADDSDFRSFVEGIPGFLFQGSSNLLRNLLNDRDINLGPRIAQQLHFSGFQESSEKLKRATDCLGAIWSIFAYCWHADIPDNEVEGWFDEETLPVFEVCQYDGPIITHYLSSTVALFSTSLLDSYFSSALAMERELRQLGAEPPWVTFEPRKEQTRVQNYLSSTTPDIGAGCIMAMKTWLYQLQQDFVATKAELVNQPMHPPSTDELLHSLWAFQALVDDARLTIYVNFLSKLLSDFPPYEALATFLHLGCDYVHGLPVSLHNQALVVDLLKEYTEIPRVAVDQLLNCVMILDNPELVAETQDIVSEYLQLYPDSEAASKALLLLQLQDESFHGPVASQSVKTLFDI